MNFYILTQEYCLTYICHQKLFVQMSVADCEVGKGAIGKQIVQLLASYPGHGVSRKNKAAAWVRGYTVKHDRGVH